MKTDHLKTLPTPVKRRLRALENLHKTFGDLERQYRDELDSLERKYSAMYAPLFDRRSAIVKGEAEPSDDECAGFVGEPEAIPAGIRGIPL